MDTRQISTLHRVLANLKEFIQRSLELVAASLSIALATENKEIRCKRYACRVRSQIKQYPLLFALKTPGLIQS